MKLNPPDFSNNEVVPVSLYSWKVKPKLIKGKHIRSLDTVIYKYVHFVKEYKTYKTDFQTGNA